MRISAVSSLSIHPTPWQEVDRTYPYVRSHEPSYIERTFQKAINAIENNEDHTCDHTVTSFEPLSMTLVRILRMVPIVHRRLTATRVSPLLRVIQGPEKRKVGSADGHVDNQTRNRAIRSQFRKAFTWSPSPTHKSHHHHCGRHQNSAYRHARPTSSQPRRDKLRPRLILQCQSMKHTRSDIHTIDRTSERREDENGVVEMSHAG